MDGDRVYDDECDLIDLLENSNNSLWLPSPSPSLHETMGNFDQEPLQSRTTTLKRDYNDYDNDEEECKMTRLKMEKKRRLTRAQIEYLEKSFEMDNKLEPERKFETAKKLGLQARQIAIWFQNRRARFKTKQLEIEHASLKLNYDRLKIDFDSISNDRDNLLNEVKALTRKLKDKEITSKNNNQLAEEETISTKSEILDSKSPESDFSPPLLTMYNNILKVEDNVELDELIITSSLVDEQPFWSMLY